MGTRQARQTKPTIQIGRARSVRGVGPSPGLDRLEAVTALIRPFHTGKASLTKAQIAAEAMAPAPISLTWLFQIARATASASPAMGWAALSRGVAMPQAMN